MRFPQKNKAFTLIELIIVIAVVGVLAATFLIKFAGVDDDAQKAKFLSIAGAFSSAIDVAQNSFVVSEGEAGVTQLSDFGNLYTNSQGFPCGTNANCKDSPSAQGCLEVWNAILKNPPANSVGASIAPGYEFSTRLNGNVCQYFFTNGSVINYDMLSGVSTDLTSVCPADTNYDNDVNNCGGCGNVCNFANAGATCDNGTCTLGTCNPGYADCDGSTASGCETHIDSDANNCNGCGNVCSGAGAICNNGSCEIPGSCSVDADCSAPNATAQCISNMCQVVSCNTNYYDCNNDIGNYLITDGCETFNMSGGCSSGGCTIDADCQANEYCDNGTCRVLLPDGSNCNTSDQCSSGFCVEGVCCNTACTGDCETCLQAVGASSNGVCSVSAPGTDPKGACGPNNLSCDGTSSSCLGCSQISDCDLPNATAACTANNCVIDTCDAGFLDCDSNVINGCEVDFNNDIANCGGCGVACGASEYCINGSCSGTCPSGFADCDQDLSNGCETDIANSINNCGACGTGCINPNGTTVCSSGVCTPTCDSGYGDCDSDPSNGCESTLDTLQNCGTCGNTCVNNHGVSECVSGACQIISCDAGASACQAPEDGCANTDNDPQNCGACGVVCANDNGTSTCQNGVCVPSCNAGFADCDGDPNNGCEANLNTDIQNCSACGAACVNDHGVSQCNNAVCEIVSCDPDYYDCNLDATDGCEAQLGDDTNCTACNDTCAGDEVCQSEADGCKKDLGATCSIDADCDSGHCAVITPGNSICCQSDCSATCNTCTGANSTCEFVANGNDPLNQCTFACDGNGACQKNNGESCSSAAECGSGFCVDGVCCENSCTATCFACSVSGSLGQCVAVPNGQDPRDDCPFFEGATNDYEGVCNGSGACKVTPGQVCTSAANCLSGFCRFNAANGNSICCDSTSCTGKCETCDSGFGVCVHYPNGYPVPGCANGCSGDGVNCAPQPNGWPCSSNSECTSGFCRDGYCCNNGCPASGFPNVCVRCDGEFTTVNSPGTCRHIVRGTDPENECAGDLVCNEDYTCKVNIGDVCNVDADCITGATCTACTISKSGTTCRCE